MRTVQGNTLRALHNVQGFLNENADRLGGVISTGSRAMLDSAIAELEEHAAMQDGRARVERGAVALQRARRLALIRDHMAPIDRIARFLLADVPDLVALHLPRGRPTVERLVALAGGMAEAAEPHAEVFIRTGRKPTFITDLRAAADALLQALQDRYANRSKVRMATSGLQTGMSRARKLVNVLDTLVRSELANDPDLLAGWNLARRVSQPRTSHAAEAASVPEASIAEPAARAPEPLPLAAASWPGVPFRPAVGVVIAELREGRLLPRTKVPDVGFRQAVRELAAPAQRLEHGYEQLRARRAQHEHERRELGGRDGGLHRSRDGVLDDPVIAPAGDQRVRRDPQHEHGESQCDARGPVWSATGQNAT